MPIMKGLVLKAAPFILGAGIIAGIVHGVSVLIMPQLAPRNAAALLSSGTQPNGMEHLRGAQTGKAALPFADPSLLTSLCRYDISEGPVRLRIATGDDFMSVVFLDPGGKVIYSLTDKAATRRQIDILIGSPAQIRQVEAQDPDDEAVQELRLRQASPQGIVVIRAMALRSSDTPQIAALLERSDCQQE
jgi:uncharacterized membrane protein